ncbi:MAG: 50S ribosomal protein L29 [Anaerolineae bacterium]|nr:50S ribosomal protein L29 [Anaerolineae bacterium]
MRISEIREMTDAQLGAAVESAREEMLNLRIQLGLGTLENYTRVKELKKDIARMLTVKRERELAAQIVGASTSE